MLVDMTGGKKPNRKGNASLSASRDGLRRHRAKTMGRGGGTAQGQDPRGDRALEPGFWSGWTKAPKKTHHKIFHG